MFNNSHEATEAYKRLDQLMSELEMHCVTSNIVDPDRLTEFNRVWAEIGRLTNDKN